MTPERLMEMIQGIQASAVLRAGIELGAFDALAAGDAPAPKVASSIGADPRGTRILLDALSALGVIEKSGADYRLGEAAKAHLVSGQPGYLGDAGRLFTGDHIWEMMRTLPAAVRKGGTTLSEHAETPEHSFWEDFARWTGAMAGLGGMVLAQLVAPWLEKRGKTEVLDIACGTGLYGFSVASAAPHAHVTSQDWPNVLEHTKGYAQKMGVTDRVRYLPGDSFTADLGGPYDLVILSHIFHHFNEERCAELMRRVAEVLAPGGRVAIHDFIATEDSPAKDPGPFMFSIVMLAWTREGESHDLARYERLLAGAGLGEPEVHPSNGMPTRFLIAEKR